MSHGIIVCEGCGTVLTSCRCMENHKRIPRGFCQACGGMNKAAETPKAPASVEALINAYTIAVVKLERETRVDTSFGINMEGVVTAGHARNEARAALLAAIPTSPPAPAEAEYMKAEFLEEVWEHMGHYLGCTTGDCPHHDRADCETAVKATAREMAEEYLKGPAHPPAVPPLEGAQPTGLRARLIAQGAEDLANDLCGAPAPQPTDEAGAK